MCTYKLHEDDDDRNLCYQIQLLQALKINKYDSTLLTAHIDKISYFLQNNSEINEILMLLKEKYKTSNIAFLIDERNTCPLFQLLFSYEYFDIFHKYLCKYIKDKTQKNDTEIIKPYFEELKAIITL